MDALKNDTALVNFFDTLMMDERERAVVIVEKMVKTWSEI